MQEFLNQTYFGNTLLNYAIALGSSLVGAIIIFIINKVVLVRLQKWAKATKTKIDDFLLRGLEKAVVPILYVIIFYLSVKTLTLHPKVERAIDVIYCYSCHLLHYKNDHFGIKVWITFLYKNKSRS